MHDICYLHGFVIREGGGNTAGERFVGFFAARTRAGLAAARKRGKRLGPPVKWQADMARKAQVLLDKGDLNTEEVARTLKVSRRTLFRGLKAARGPRRIAGELAHVKSAALSGRLTR